MGNDTTELQVYFGRCKCCIKYGYMKNLWDEYIVDRTPEVYGAMLTECFGFTADEIKVSQNDQICDNCIATLRDSLVFRNMFLASQIALEQELHDHGTIAVKVDAVSDSECTEVDFLEDNNEEKSEEEEDDIFKTVKEELSEKDIDADSKFAEVVIIKEEPPEEEYFVEFLEETEEPEGTHAEEMVEEYLKDTDNTQEYERSLESDDEYEPEPKTDPKSKWPKKLPKNQRLKTYMQYTEQDLRQAIKDVLNNKRTVAEASKFYSIPKKSLDAKVRKERNSTSADPNQESRYNLHQEIKTILTYTNATPFRSRISKYCCAYCLGEDVLFEDPSDLRNHVRTVHVDDRTKKVDLFMRPHYANEVLKLDIDQLMCVVCFEPIREWNHLFLHLQKKHNVQLEESLKRVIPYVLETNVRCVFCKQKFTNFPLLDTHMNLHYKNYMCGTCGDTFVTQTRLKTHSLLHNLGNFKCRYCEKEFTLTKYRRKHEAMVHRLKASFKCLYCGDKFEVETERQRHVEEQHSEKMKLTTCEKCGKTFKWRQYYIAHLRKVHGEKKNKCPECGKKYLSQSLLKEHLYRHKGLKMFSCPECKKEFFSRSAVRMHRRLKKH